MEYESENEISICTVLMLNDHTSPCELKNVTSPNRSVFADKAHI